MKLPKDLRAFITGGGGGLGRALALEVAAPGVRLLLADVNEERARESAALARARGAEAEAIVCDVTRPEELARAAETMERRHGGTDLLVNNAGVSCAGEVGSVPLADWRWIMDVNLWGVIHGCHAFVPSMKARRSGFILNVASSAGIVCLPEMGPYNVTKAGVIALSETLAAELMGHGITVTALCPTFFNSGILESLRASDPRQTALAQKLLRRANVPAEKIARAAVRALAASRLIEIPQTDGRLLWLAKRAVPQLFSRQIGRAWGRWIRRARRRTAPVGSPA